MCLPQHWHPTNTMPVRMWKLMCVAYAAWLVISQSWMLFLVQVHPHLSQADLDKADNFGLWWPQLLPQAILASCMPVTVTPPGMTSLPQTQRLTAQPMLRTPTSQKPGMALCCFSTTNTIHPFSGLINRVL